ncbi:MAG TPA: hypothetical protein VL460_05865 [Caulobacteraceae bacterium]|jgi:hypothetical protein|nr:hypothetical protein [Caulobacteraceae bacterium]
MTDQYAYHPVLAFYPGFVPLAHGEKTCGCGPDCRCGDDCACGPNGKCDPACTCAE